MIKLKTAVILAFVQVGMIILNYIFDKLYWESPIDSGLETFSLVMFDITDFILIVLPLIILYILAKLYAGGRDNGTQV